MTSNLKSPIVTVAGHVDHGKTSLLDYLRQSSVVSSEAGRITQKISFSFFPADKLKKMCPLIDKRGVKLDIPGFLFIDTPGHAAFSNLRKRGGSLADLAILVIDINEGIKPQTSEVLQILKLNKVPFVIALNKVDNVSGWKKQSDDLIESLDKQSINCRQNFDEKLFTIIGALSSYGFEADLFFNITDFTKKLALIPISAKTGEGIPELLFMLCGLSQKYLTSRLQLGDEAKGVILEIKKDKTINYLESILYDGKLSVNDEIAIAGFDDVTITKIRSLQEIQPMSSNFKNVQEVKAATGIRMQIISKADVLPGMPFMIVKKNVDQLKSEFKKEISDSIKTEKYGIIAKADSLGSLEALLVLLRQENLSIVKAGIGNINKSDIITAKANLEINELDSLVVGFNVGVDEDAKELAKDVKIIIGEIVYKIIDDVKVFRMEKSKEIEKKRLMELAPVCKLKILHEHMFRNSNPAVFGVEILAGKIVTNITLIDETGQKVGRLKGIQSENKSVEEAKEGMQVAISIPGINFERVLGDKKFLYSDITQTQFKTFKKNKDLLSNSELKALQEVASIKETINWE